MSGKIAGMVWDLDLPQNEMLVLLALADHAGHDGRNAFPGVDLLAYKTGYCPRQVQRILDTLEAKRLAIPQGRTQGGRGRTVKYRICLENGTLKPPFAPVKDRAKNRGREDGESRDRQKTPAPSLFDVDGAQPDTTAKMGPDAESVAPPPERVTSDAIKGDISPPERVTSDAIKGDISPPERVTSDAIKGDISPPERVTSDAIKGDISDTLYKDMRLRLNRQEPSFEPSGKEREENAPAPNSYSAGSAAASRIGRTCAAPAPPSLEDVRCWLREIGQSESHAEKFHAYYDERGWTKGRDNRPVEDWRKTLTTWLSREPEFQSRGSASSAASKPARAAVPPGQSALGTRANEKIERLAAIKAASSSGTRLEAPAGRDIPLKGKSECVTT